MHKFHRWEIALLHVKPECHNHINKAPIKIQFWDEILPAQSFVDAFHSNVVVDEKLLMKNFHEKGFKIEGCKNWK